MICHHCNREIEYAAVCPYCGTRMLKEPLPHHLSIGTMIDNRYEVLGVLGEGGFGITYLGINRNLDLTVAIKEFYPQGVTYRDTKDGKSVYSSSDNSAELFSHGKESFLGEAKTLVKFNSEPGIVSVLDIINENNTAYLIMEYLDGETLQQHLRQHGKMKVSDAFKLLKPMMKTLKKVHDAGIIHRDISPDNIMMLRDGSLKLMDFGAARMFEDDHRSMSVMLKKGYAPEEQYRRNGEQGPWTDVYALCATIYRCITGKSPIDSLERLAGEELTPPSKIGAAISPALEKVLMNGLAVHKRDRIQGMAELLSAVEETMSSMPPKTAQPAPQEKAQKTEDEPAAQTDSEIKNVADSEDQDPYQTMLVDRPNESARPTAQTDDTQDQHRTTLADQQDKLVATEKPKKSRKKLWILIIVIILIAAAMFVIGIVLNNSKSNQSTSNIDQSNNNSYQTDDGFVYRIYGDNAVSIDGYKGAQSKIELPSEIDGHTVTRIGANAFSNSGDLTSVIIPDSVIIISYSAFSGCSNLESVTIGNSVTNIGVYAFWGCSNLKSITIPDSVKTISDTAFLDCKSLTSVTIPDSVTTIGVDVFDGCDNLTISGKKGSYAEKYANNMNIPFSEI